MSDIMITVFEGIVESNRRKIKDLTPVVAGLRAELRAAEAAGDAAAVARLDQQLASWARFLKDARAVHKHYSKKLAEARRDGDEPHQEAN